jgi:hypothetical protein
MAGSKQEKLVQSVSCDRFWVARTHLTPPDLGAHTQFEVVAFRTRTLGKITFFSNFSFFFHSFFKLFSAIFQHFYGFGCSKTEKDDPKQERTFQSRK